MLGESSRLQVPFGTPELNHWLVAITSQRPACISDPNLITSLKACAEDYRDSSTKRFKAVETFDEPLT